MTSTRRTYFPARGPVREVLHGVEVEDPFRWLEEQESPETRSFIQMEQQSYRKYLDHHKELRSRVERRVAELLTVASVDLPVPDQHGGLLYLKREAKEEQKAIYYRDKKNMEKLLISVTMLGRDSYTSLAILQVSPDGRYLVFGVRTGGEDLQEIRIYDLAERVLLEDGLPRGFYRGMVFDKGASGFYYVHEESTGRYQYRRAVRRHEFGRDQQEDIEVFYAGDGPALRLILQGAEDGSALGYLIVSLESVPQTRFLIHDFPLLTLPHEILRLSGASFGPRFSANTIEASTTHAAPRGRIVRISPEHAYPQAWNELFPETAERLHSWSRYGKLWVIHYTAGSSMITRVYSKSCELVRTISYPASGTSTLGLVDVCSHRLFYSHSDIAEPSSICAVNLITGQHQLWWEQPKFVRPEASEIEVRTYPSRDGTAIPLTLIHPRNANGARPVLLSAYGGGGVSTTPKFSILLTILVEAGFTCATAHVRGGGEGGLNWHHAAQKQYKQTSVDDLISASEWLIKSEYTTPEQLGLAGQSAGALLALCAMTQQPNLFRAAMVLGPLTDLTRFHLFGVARGFVAELGSPENPDEFAALYRLSPYHRVDRRAHYPAVLIISGDRDKRCDSLHARKMIARLKSTTDQRHPVLLDYTDTRGHKSVLPLAERIRALTDRLTFLITELDIKSLEGCFHDQDSAHS
jgi:prolyl oligopeptidase